MKVFLTISALFFTSFMVVDLVHTPIDKLFLNRFFLCTYGSLFYHFIRFRFIKDQYEEDNKKFNWIKFRNEEWDNYVYTLFWIPFVAVFGREWFSQLNPAIQWEQYYYAFAGVLGDLVYAVGRGLYKSGVLQSMVNYIVKKIKKSLT